MKKHLAFILFFIVLFCSEDVFAQEKLKVKAKDDYAPFTYINEVGAISGFVMDITQYILEENHIPFETTLESDRKVIYNQLCRGEIDLVPGIFYSKTASDSLLYSNPIFYSTIAMVSNSTDPYFAIESLKGKRLLVSATDWTGEAVRNLGLSDDITTISTIEEGIQLLKSGRYDAMFFAEQVILFYISHKKIKDLVVESAEAPRSAICIGVGKNHSELLETINNSIHEMKVSGKYNDIYGNWFGVYDNKYLTDLYTFVIGGILLIAVAVIIFFIFSNRKVQRARKHAENSDQMKSMFLANISHDIRTPLNSIVGFSYLICEGGLEKEEIDKYTSIIKDNNDILLHLVDEVLDLSNIESGQMAYKPQEVDVAQLFVEMEKSFRPMMKNPEVELIVNNPYPSCILTLDARRLKQVVSNFFTNAVQFTHKGSITIGYNLNKDEITVYVTDTGIGIAEKDQKNIFGRFYKVDPVDDGHGLGLAINKAIMEALHGKIGVTSVLGHGSTFWASAKHYDKELGC